MKMKTITINQRDYALDDLSPEALQLLQRMHDAQSEINRLEAQLNAFHKIHRVSW